MPWTGNDQLDVWHFTKLVLGIVATNIVTGMYYSCSAVQPLL